jgi:signal transduction histidine kinase
VVRTRPVGRAWWQSSPLPLPAAAVALLWTLLWALGRRVPVAIPDVHPDGGAPELLSGHPLLLAGQALSAVFLLTASVLFTVRSLRGKDELFVWLGPACALAGFSRVHYMLFPSLYTDRLYAGDVLRTLCYVVLLVGAVRELRQYWAAQARAAVLDDRRRLARELHDGVVQELAFIRAESYAIPEGMPTRARIMAACDRALDEARAGIQALGRPGTEPLGFMLHRAAREMVARYDIELEVDVDDSITARAEQKYALLRIAREAVSNAVRHGEARRLCLSLTRDDDRQRLTISDNGCGFDAVRINSATGGYGLTSMRDRARALPGSLDLSSERGAGTQVTVTW